MPPCPRCRSTAVKRDGHPSPADQRYRCRRCCRTFTDRTGAAFAGYRFPAEVIRMAVRWYTLYRLSAANVRDLLAERGIDISDRAVLSWVHVFGPRLAAAARRHGRRIGHC
jgi:transposase-like protein